MRIGLDFDNTIIRYDEVFLAAARERGLIPDGFVGAKQAIRDAIRLTPDGEIAWQRLQGFVYGAGVGAAEAFPGLDRFLAETKRRGDTVLIVSHKTEFGHYDPDRVDLRAASRRWMETTGFFAVDGFAIAPGNVFFEPTREEKLRRIRAVECDVFVDDLIEVLEDADFPPGVDKILFGSNPSVEVPSGIRVCKDWDAVARAVFD